MYAQSTGNHTAHMLEKNIDQKFGFKKKLEHFSEKKKDQKVCHLKNINQILLKIPWGKSFNLTLISKGKHQNNDKIALSRSSDGAERATGA